MNQLNDNWVLSWAGDIRRKTGVKVKVSSRSVVFDSATPWFVAHQEFVPMEFSGKNAGVGCLPFSGSS